MPPAGGSSVPLFVELYIKHIRRLAKFLVRDQPIDILRILKAWQAYLAVSFRTALEKSPEQNKALRALFMKQELPKLTSPTLPKG